MKTPTQHVKINQPGYDRAVVYVVVSVTGLVSTLRPINGKEHVEIYTALTFTDHDTRKLDAASRLKYTEKLLTNKKHI
jgi:hypothetical protein